MDKAARIFHVATIFTALLLVAQVVMFVNGWSTWLHIAANVFGFAVCLAYSMVWQRNA